MEIGVTAFTTYFNRISYVLENEVYIDKSDITPPKVPQDPISLNLNKYKVIWDTGATHSAVTRKVIDECGLIPVTRTIVNTASGPKETGIFLADIYLPNKVIIRPVRVTECEIVTEAELLIGMDIISKGDFAVTNKNGKTTFSFRLPSIEHIDFVKQIEKIKYSGTRPNSPCPCNSGKRFKDCHGKAPQK